MRDSGPQAIGKLLSCLSLLEMKAYTLYKTVADKVDLPFVKSLMLIIAHDSQKHSLVLKGVCESLNVKDVKPKDCERNAGVSWRAIETIQKQIEKKGKLSDADLLELTEQLGILESTVGEEYYVFVQLKTLELMMKEIGRDYGLDLSSLKDVFIGIIYDEEHHRELVEKTKAILERRLRPQTISSPIVRYQNPDAWIRPAV